MSSAKRLTILCSWWLWVGVYALMFIAAFCTHKNLICNFKDCCHFSGNYLILHSDHKPNTSSLSLALILSVERTFQNNNEYPWNYFAYTNNNLWVCTMHTWMYIVHKLYMNEVIKNEMHFENCHQINWYILKCACGVWSGIDYYVFFIPISQFKYCKNKIPKL